MKKIIWIITVLCFATFGIAQKPKDLNVSYLLRGYIYAASSINDSNALGGFGGSGNYAVPITENPKLNQTGFYLLIDTTKNTIWAEKYNGHELYLVNRSDSTVVLTASDSRLSVIAEVYYKNKWQAIEYLPSSWCGNSYHKVYLKEGEFWQFDVPKFTGKIKTKVRYRLAYKPNEFLYSNEIEASFNKKQLTEQMQYNPKGLMDPYND